MLFRLLLTLVYATLPVYAQGGILQPRTGLRILAPLSNDPNAAYLPPSAPGTIQIIYTYFSYAQQWIFGVAAGFCILQVLIGGFMILNSGGDPSKRSEGVTKAMWSIAGLLLLAVVSSFMWFLNPGFYN